MPDILYNLTHFFSLLTVLDSTMSYKYYVGSDDMTSFIFLVEQKCAADIV